MQPSAVSSLGADADALIGAIMKRCGARGEARQFHAAVNVTFHEFESEVYDVEHAVMWQSLPRQFTLLVDDCLARPAARLPEKIRLLDIGCGTGLATDSILASALGPRIASIDVIDTSPAMLRRCRERASRWKVPAVFHEGLVESLAGRFEFDLVVTCSVLHHVPDLEAFVRSVRDLQPCGGVFLHVQDPNGDYLGDPALARRTAQYSKTALPQWAMRLAPKRIAGRLIRELTGRQGDDVVSRTNRSLLGSRVISSALTVKEIFSITDIHVQNDRGISLSRLQGWMADRELVSRRSYAFFGELSGALPPVYRRQEEDLIDAHQPNGYHVGAAWSLPRAAASG